MATGSTRGIPENGTTKTCRRCATPFNQIRVNQLFCSPHCKNLFHEVPKALRVIERYLCTVTEAAILSGRKPWQIRYAIKKGKLEQIRLPNGSVMVRRSDVLPTDETPAAAG